MAAKNAITQAYRLTEPFAPHHRPNAVIPVGTIVHQAADSDAMDLVGNRERAVSMDPSGRFPTLSIPADLLEPVDLPPPNLRPISRDPALRTHKDFALEHGQNLVRGLGRLFDVVQRIRAVKGVPADEFSEAVRSVAALKYAFEKRMNRALAFGFGPDIATGAGGDDAEQRCYMIRKGGYWLRENGFGYTTRKRDAGRFTKAEAEAQAQVEPMHMRAIHENDVAEDAPAATVEQLTEQIEQLKAERQALLDTDRWSSDVRIVAARDQGARLAWDMLITHFSTVVDTHASGATAVALKNELEGLAGFDVSHLEAFDPAVEETIQP